MKAPLSWLREFVPIELSAEELASSLALSGTEVERVTESGVPGGAENLARFVVGRVLECDRHPDADRLSVCQVEVGDGRPRTIVCGAPNVAAGQTVAVVLPGGVLPGGAVIKESKLRGVASAGMILSESELGLAAKSAGIMVLPDEWKAGGRLSEHFAITDWVLEVEVTPNRPDCLCIRGLAREIAAVTGTPFQEELGYSHPWGDRPIETDMTIEVVAPDLCPRYTGRVIRGVTIAESPLWLKARLSHAGLRPISNAVDVTNYVQWALGQPLHAFDLRTIRGGTIIVRRALRGETLTTLDGQTRTLTEEMLVIADAERASVVAGVMGGLDSEITDSTTDILLEGANFWGPSIMRTSAALGLRSEASTRYEKGLDPEMIDSALDLACSLFVHLCGGTVSKGTIDVRMPRRDQRRLRLRDARIEHVLGMPVPSDETASLLSRLGCTVSRVDGGFAVTVPSFRADLEREIDLIEEVVRIHGLERIPATLPTRKAGRGGLTKNQAVVRRIEDLLVGAGLVQVVSYSFGDDRWPDALRLAADDVRRQGASITNPLSADQGVMRTMLLPGLLATAQRNVSVREERVPIFEVGRVYLPSGAELPNEPTRVGILIAGAWDGDSWLRAEVVNGYFLVKGIVERVSAGLHASLGYAAAEQTFLNPGRSAEVCDSEGRSAGWIGELHPLVAQAYDLRGPVASAELDVDALVGAATEVVTFRDLLAYPAVEQDIALVVKAGVPAAKVVESVRRAGGKLLDQVWVFDLYEGAQVGEGNISLALRLSFRASDRTLTESEVNGLRAEMVRTVASELGAELRGKG
jgi:phenylalanyl-tRNA synthetase beta chain